MSPQKTEKNQVLCPHCAQPMVWRAWGCSCSTEQATGWECINLECLRRVPSYLAEAQAA